MMASKLRLQAAGADDLSILSACLQDALVMIGDMTYLPDEQRFLLAANRFVWEEAGEKFRTVCGVVIDRVTAVRYRRLDPGRTVGILSLLALRAAPGGIDLVFSGGADIRLESTAIQIRLEDISEPWPTLWRPRHED